MRINDVDELIEHVFMNGIEVYNNCKSFYVASVGLNIMNFVNVYIPYETVHADKSFWTTEMNVI